MSNTLKQLQSFWYEQLKRIGFNDIESNDGRLKHHINPKQTAAKSSYQETREYYLLASEFTQHFKFETELDGRIWLLYAEGKTERFTASKLKVGRGLVQYRLKKMKEHFELWLKRD